MRYRVPLAVLVVLALPVPGPAGALAEGPPAPAVDARPVIGQSALDDPAGGPLWSRFGFDALPVAVTAVVGSPRFVHTIGLACTDRWPCRKPPSEPDPFEKREEVFGPIENTGWASFAHVGNRRLYAYPQTVRSKERPAGQSWTWGLGAQVDALRLTGLGDSTHEFFAFGEVGAGYDAMPTPSGYNYQARLTIGVGF